MKKLAVIGGRNFSDKDLLYRTLDGHTSNVELIISGGAIGADTLAVDYAKQKRIPWRVIKPDYARYGKKFAPVKRNEEIVLMSDEVIAFWDGKTTGTKTALDYAKKHNRRTKVISFSPIESQKKSVSRSMI